MRWYQEPRFRVRTDTALQDKRYIPDRRLNRRISLKHFIFGGRRQELRRAEDKHGLKYVDEYSPRLMGLIILLIILSIVDGLMTLHLMDKEVLELNPIMSFCLDLGPWFFLAAKFLFTCFGATCLLIVSNSYAFGGRIQVRDVFPAMVCLYLMVMFWNSFLYVMA
jgi:hypothetical protein